jgi:hypothetical protein
MTSPKVLKSILGQPDTCDEYKVSGEYSLELNGVIFYLYDWKSTKLYDSDYQSPETFWNSNKLYDFHIGGNQDAHEILDLIKYELIKLTTIEPNLKLVK